MFKFLLVVHALIAASLVGVILMQRSEGGGLAGGGSPTGLLSARGAGDFLTRTTAILATLFILLSIGIAALATVDRGNKELDNTLNRAPVGAPALPTMPGVPIGGAAAPAAGPVTAPVTVPAAAAPMAAAPGKAPATLAAPAKATPKPAARTDQPAPRRPALEAPKAQPKPVTLPPIVSTTPKADPAPASTTPTAPQ